MTASPCTSWRLHIWLSSSFGMLTVVMPD